MTHSSGKRVKRCYVDVLNGCGIKDFLKPTSSTQGFFIPYTAHLPQTLIAEVIVSLKFFFLLLGEKRGARLGQSGGRALKTVSAFL